MKYVEAKLPTDLEYVDIYSVSDVHRGNHCFSEKSWYTLLENIKGDPHAVMVLNGDGVESALKSSKYGETYATMRPKEERKQLTKDLEPVKGKIIGATSGNHDARAEKDSDENVMDRVMEDLGLHDPDHPTKGIYHPIGLLLDVQFGTRHKEVGRRNSFSFYITHGSGGGRRPGGKINRMQELAWVCDGVDGYMMGHVHSLSSYIDYRYSPDPQNKQIRKRAVAYVISGSLLDYGGYAQVGMYSPNAVSMPILRLWAKRQTDEHKHMEIVLPTMIRPRTA